MQVVIAKFETRQGLVGMIGDAGGGSFVNVPGAQGISAGERVLLRVMGPGLEVGVFLEGVVQSRRMSMSLPAVSALRERETAPPAPSMGVQLLGHEHPTLEFLRAWTTRGVTAKRARWRFPYDARAHIQVAEGAVRTSRLLHGTTLNVSESGVMLSSARQLPAAVDATFMLEFEGSLCDFEAKTVWSFGSRTGLRLTLKRPEEALRWLEIVDAVARDFASREWVRPSQRPQ